MDKKVDFGFAEHFTKQWMSKSKYFPSKIGGRPSFLVLNPVLGPEQLSCPKCKNIMRFILQLYAPIDSNNNAFHRQLLVFACAQSKQCSDQFSVFRCQLPRNNKFYSYDPPDYEQDSPDYDPNPEKFGLALCPVCGINAPKRCSQCMKISYCSRGHQIIHWKKGGHKEICTKDNIHSINENPIQNNSTNYENIIFPEYEIVIDEDNEKNENDDNNDNENNDDDVSESAMKKYQEFVQKSKPIFQNENIDQYVEKEDDDDDNEYKIFYKFKKASIRGEVVRYYFDWYEKNNLDNILWISNKNRPENVPQCENCGSQRRIEFQIMPNLLNKILINNQMDSLDWGTLLVFSCPRSCNQNRPNETNVSEFYFQEFIYQQKIS